MTASPLDGILGRLVVQQQIMDEAQVADLQTAAESMGSSLGDILLDTGLVDEAQLNQLLAQAKQIAARPATTPRPSPVPPGSSARLAPVPSSSSTRLPPVPSSPAPAPSSSSARLPPVQPAAPTAGTSRAQPLPSSPAPARKSGGMTVLPTIQVPVEPEPVPTLDMDLLQPVEPATMDASDLGLVAVDGPQMPEDFVAESPLEEMKLILQIAIDMGVSDLHLHSGCKVMVRKHGDLIEQETRVFDSERIERLVDSILNARQRELFAERGELDFAYSIPGLGRVRANVYRQHYGVDATFRIIPLELPTLDSLGLPAHLVGLTEFANGLVLCTGPSGSGKSTTMAALVNIINNVREDHILTIEDPIEFVHKPLKCSVNQRQVGLHTETFPRALRGALREDPDVIVVGELRDLETIQLALSAAETGHLVFGTLHTNNAVRTVNRLINVFPPDQHDQVRAMLSESLRGVISQRLVKSVTGQKRIPATEILLVNKAVSNCIKENKTLQIKSVLQTSTSEGMCVLDASLEKLVKENRITKEEAARYAEEPRRFAS